jgi:hypothetical protein
MGHRETRRRTNLRWLVAALAALLVTVALGVSLNRTGSGSRVALWTPARPTPAGVPATTGPSASAAPSAATSPAATASGTAVPAPGGRAAASPKKGVSAWYFPGVSQALSDVHAAWYYTWAPDSGQIGKPAGIEFVPMIWGAKSVNPATLTKVRGQGHALLGFNEPDFGSQSNMSVTQALDLWPQLVATGLRLGSPAPATGAPDAGGWLDRFMTGAAAHGYRVDFIALHWYGADFSARATDQLRGYLDATYQRYHKPIWLTEYALIKFGATATYPTQAQQADFVRASTTMLERLPYLERYAWFALPASGTGNSTGLYRDGTTPTTVGAAYRAAGPTG